MGRGENGIMDTLTVVYFGDFLNNITKNLITFYCPSLTLIFFKHSFYFKKCCPRILRNCNFNERKKERVKDKNVHTLLE